MFKVICVDATIGKRTHPDVAKAGSKLTEGKVYNALFEVKALNRYGGYDKSYVLSEFPFPCAFNVKRFIPLSEIDELELVNEKQLVNQ